MAQEQILGVDRHVRLELALPPAPGLLEREEVARGACQRGVAGVEGAVGGDAHAGPPSEASAACAAVSPLRTAPSIVAGQPVSVQAPAR